MQKHTLKVEKRKIFGKQLKALRKTGILPGNIYGKDIKSEAVQLPTKEFQAVYDEVGSSGVVYLDFEGKEHPILIHALAYDYVNQKPLHADFFQVNLKEKVKTMVPLHIVGEPKAVTEKIGMLMQPVSEVEVEALPTDLPEAIEVDVTEMAEIGQSKKVADISKKGEYEILTDPELVIASIAELVSAEAQEQAAEEAAAAEEAKAAEGEEGVTPAEGAESDSAKKEGEAAPEGETKEAPAEKPAE